MWRRPSILRGRWCHYSTACVANESPLAPLKLYVIAGEASGDAIGAKVIRALQRHRPPRKLEFRGIGGPQMCEAGGFESLFPMQELSVMGLVEVVPYIWRFRRRIQDTLCDIEAFQPELVLTIDSKGFTFRVLKALQAGERKTGGKRIKKAHYVAPSVWAYKHRGKRDFTELKQLLDAMFTILPFEEGIFEAAGEQTSLKKVTYSEMERSWCHFVGHPAVEDFLEVHGVYESGQQDVRPGLDSLPACEIETEADALLDLSKYDRSALEARGRLFYALANHGRQLSTKTHTRESFGIPAEAFVICALVGSRANEVKKSSQLVLDAIKAFEHQNNLGPKRQVYVVFPTIAAVEEQLIASIPASVSCRVLSDLDAEARHRLFQASDVAVAVSGTIVLETTLANLPTIVIYRANRLTELIAQQLAAVRFVSVPNLLLGRPVLPELLFSNCTAPKIAEALRELVQDSPTQDDALQLATAVSTLTKWQDGDAKLGSNSLIPIRASDLVAQHIFKVLEKN